MGQLYFWANLTPFSLMQAAAEQAAGEPLVGRRPSTPAGEETERAENPRLEEAPSPRTQLQNTGAAVLSSGDMKDLFAPSTSAGEETEGAESPQLGEAPSPRTQLQKMGTGVLSSADMNDLFDQLDARPPTPSSRPASREGARSRSGPSLGG